MLAFAVQIVKLELAATAADVVDASGKTELNVLELLSGGDRPLLSVFTDKVCDRLGDMELVGVWIRFLSLLELQDRPGAKFVVLLESLCRRGVRTRPE